LAQEVFAEPGTHGTTNEITPNRHVGREFMIIAVWREPILDVKRRRNAGPSVGERLQAAYEQMVARRRK